MRPDGGDRLLGVEGRVIGVTARVRDETDDVSDGVEYSGYGLVRLHLICLGE